MSFLKAFKLRLAYTMAKIAAILEHFDGIWRNYHGTASLQFKLWRFQIELKTLNEPRRENADRESGRGSFITGSGVYGLTESQVPLTFRQQVRSKFLSSLTGLGKGVVRKMK
ncbi:hypothetical protein CEXT_421871 [Caerostris extrusa]|uniref:Uncharacterized protein n=1 Tax=Caerostris extrusa TaxID=172846 RepID=A0AAV4NC72_CAEEX|nr:hypothetical protein CEXT_421871 [Caerostris extrusa]